MAWALAVPHKTLEPGGVLNAILCLWHTHSKVNMTNVCVTLTVYNLHAGQPGLDVVTVTVYFTAKNIIYFLCKIYKLFVFASNCLCVYSFHPLYQWFAKCAPNIFVKATLKLTIL
jgi:hypothetical protein